MTDSEIFEKIKNYFSIEELVDKATYDKYGEAKCWQFLCPRLLETLIILREGIGKSMTINSWKNGGSQQQRGLRHNRSSMVKNKGSIYLSAHMLGKAVDITVSGMEAEDARNWIVENQDLFPYKIRLEHKKNGVPISWLHIDVYSLESNPHVYLFNV